MKIALLSAWNPYHAEEFVRSVRAIPGAELVCVWDDDAARGAAFAQRAGVPICGDLAAALASYGARGAIINAAPWENASLICAAAERGLHVLADKIPAMGKEQADMVARCVQAAPVVFAVAWPLLHRSYFQTARAVATSGALGKITMLRLRGAHGGGSGGTLPRRFYTRADGGVLKMCIRDRADIMLDELHEEGKTLAGAMMEYAGYDAARWRGLFEKEEEK